MQHLLRLFYPVAISEPEFFVIGTDIFSVEIAPKCSGYEGIGLISIFITAFLWRFQNEVRFPRALVLLPLGIVTIWIVNSLRITVLIAIGTSISPTIAEYGFHSLSGWIAFNAIALAIVAIAWNSPIFLQTSQVEERVARGATYPAAAYLIPFLILVAVAMITGAFSHGSFDVLYPLRVIASACALAYFLKAYRKVKTFFGMWHWQAAAIGIAASLLWIVSAPAVPASGGHRLDYIPGLARLSSAGAMLWVTARIVGSIMIAPIAEELAFRGYLTRALIAKDFDSIPIGQFTWFSFITSSVCFGLLHDRWIAGTIAGMLFAVAVYHRRRLIDGVIAHATANVVLTVYVLITKEWALWS